jgi:diaminopimelate epimerase
MKFTKMQGAGNDYIYIDCFREEIDCPKKAAILLSDRHYGIGADGLVLIRPSSKADLFMDMYNADGSRGKMCGNAIRCVARYAYDQRLTAKKKISIETLSGIREVEISTDNNEVCNITVHMGKPELSAKKIPVQYPSDFPKDVLIDEPMEIGGRMYRVTCVSMGNPHAVVFVPDPDRLRLEEIGPYFEFCPFFPERINTEFVTVIDENRIRMRVWERGSGETLGCGTGACAAVVASALNGYVKEETDVILAGGRLKVKWDRKRNEVILRGTAEYVFSGEVNVEQLKIYEK